MLRIAELFLFLSSVSVGTVLAMEGAGWRIQSSIGWLLYTGGSPTALGVALCLPDLPVLGALAAWGQCAGGLCILYFPPLCPRFLCAPGWHCPLCSGYPILAEASKIPRLLIQVMWLINHACLMS